MLMNKEKFFSGFSQETLDFLKNITANNSKSLFEENRHIYEKYLLQPFKNLVADLAGDMLLIDGSFNVQPAVNKTISRIFRDTRFSKDKSLFRGNMWLTLKRNSENWKVEPAYFFEIFSDWYRYGMGYYSASRETMDLFRLTIDEKPTRFMKAIDFFHAQNLFELKGENYKRAIPNRHPPIIQPWYQKKSFYLVCNKKIENVLFSSQLVE